VISDDFLKVGQIHFLLAMLISCCQYQKSCSTSANIALSTGLPSASLSGHSIHCHRSVTGDMSRL